MHWSRWAACACAVALALTTIRADAAGVYEDAATESALLVAPQEIMVRGTVEVADSPGMDASLYRLIGAFPARSWFLLWLELPLVSVTDSNSIESGVGDFLVRTRVRAWNSHGRAISLLATLGTGSGNTRFFPYSAQTFDICTSIGFVDSIGALQPFAIVGYEWVNRVDEDRYTEDTQPASFARATIGTDLELGSRTDLRGGVMQHWYATGAERTLVFAGANYDWTPMFRLIGEGQAEIGPQSQRVGDWSLTAGLAVTF